MDILTELDLLTGRIAVEFNSVNTSIGDKDSLSTSAKSSIVEAINEIKSNISVLEGVDLVRDDLNSSSTYIWSINKIKSNTSFLIDSLWTNVPQEYDSLKKISDKLNDLTVEVSDRVSYSSSDNKSTSEKSQARANIDAPSTGELSNVQEELEDYKLLVGNTSYNFIPDFENEL